MLICKCNANASCEVHKVTTTQLLPNVAEVPIYLRRRELARKLSSLLRSFVWM